MALESEPGRGSRFSFRIPLGVRARRTAAADARRRDSARIVIGLHPVIRRRRVRHDLDRERARDQRAIRRSTPSRRCGTSARASRRVRVIIDANARREARTGGERPARRRRAAPRRGDRADAARRRRRAAAGRESLPREAAVHAGSASPTAPSDTAQSMRMRALPTSGSRGRALVVEDNAVNQEMARAMLDMLGFDVLTASQWPGRRDSPRPRIPISCSSSWIARCR